MLKDKIANSDKQILELQNHPKKLTGRMRNEHVRSLETIMTAPALSNSPQ